MKSAASWRIRRASLQNLMEIWKCLILLGFLLLTKLQIGLQRPQCSKLIMSLFSRAHSSASTQTTNSTVTDLSNYQHLVQRGISSWNLLLDSLIERQICRLLIMAASLLKPINHVRHKVTAATPGTKSWRFHQLNCFYKRAETPEQISEWSNGLWLKDHWPLT